MMPQVAADRRRKAFIDDHLSRWPGTPTRADVALVEKAASLDVETSRLEKRFAKKPPTNAELTEYRKSCGQFVRITTALQDRMMNARRRSRDDQ